MLAGLLPRLAGLCLAGVVLSGCNAAVTTDISVTGARDSTITEIVHFDGDAGAVIAASPALQSQLEHDIATRVGGPVALSVSGSSVSWRHTVSYAQMTSNSDVTGVSAATLSSSNQTSIVTLELVRPAAIDRAIGDAAGSLKGGASLVATMERYTDVAVQVDFPGPAHVVAAPSRMQVGVLGSHVVVSQSLADWVSGHVEVTGSLAQAAWWQSPEMLALLAALALVVVASRRYTRRPRA